MANEAGQGAQHVRDVFRVAPTQSEQAENEDYPGKLSEADANDPQHIQPFAPAALGVGLIVVFDISQPLLVRPAVGAATAGRRDLSPLDALRA
jgi:hypothetical protein